MWKIAGAFAVAGLLTFLNPVRAQEDAKVRDVVDRAIKAHGGLDKLTKFKASVTKQKGKVHILDNALDFTGESSIQLPDRFRNEVKSQAGGQQVTFIQIINGNKGWVKFGEMTIEMNKDMLAEAKEQMNAGKISQLAVLANKEYKLAALGEVKVGDRPAIGIRVEHKGSRDVSLFFDKEKYLLLKMETRGKDPMQGDAEFTASTLYSDYKKTDDLMIPHKVTIERNGKAFVEAEVTEVKIAEKLDDSVFEKP